MQSHAVIKVRKRHNESKFAPHKPFENWKWHYKIPRVCILESAMLILFIVFASIYQIVRIHFGLDFNKAIDSFFLDDLGFDDQEELNPKRIGKVFFYEDFVTVLDNISQRMFDFSDLFPYGDIFSGEDIVKATVYLVDRSESRDFTAENVSEIVEYVTDFDRMMLSKVKLWRMFHVEQQDTLIDITITANFEVRREAGSIKVTVMHTELRKGSKSTFDNIRHDYMRIIPIVIACVAFLAIVDISYSLRQVYLYAKAKAESHFMNMMSVFWRKVGIWPIYSLFSHALSFVACVVYAIKDNSLSSRTSGTLILMAFATGVHFLIIFKYMALSKPTMVVAQVLLHGGISMVLFLLGCIVVVCGYTLMGVCLFGGYSDRFRTPVDAGQVLVAMIHGDSLQDMYDSVTDNGDLPAWIGSVYMTVWILFSICIIFNIVIALFEEALVKQVIRIADDGRDEHEVSRGTFLSLPIDYKKVY